MQKFDRDSLLRKEAKCFLLMRKDSNGNKEKPKSPLRRELEEYKKQGVDLRLDGHLSSPKSISQACRIAEEGNYMRDYVRRDDGKIQEVHFQLIKKRK